MRSDLWTQEEIDAAVEAYLGMLDQQSNGQELNRYKVNAALRQDKLVSRSQSSVERRMGSISAVLAGLGMPQLQGYRPMERTGPGPAAMIRDALARYGHIAVTDASIHTEKLSVTRNAVLQALARIDDAGIAPHRDSHTYDLVHNGRPYPPVAVVSFALEADGSDPVAPGRIRGGKGTPAFRALEDAGFSVIPKCFRPTNDGDALAARAAEILADDLLGDSPPAGNLHPPRCETSTESYLRDPAVKAWVLRDAGGRCQGCCEEAPFVRADGQPFLEVHHVVPLSGGGPDTVDNSVAICPNCHRRYHYAADAERATEALYARVLRLVRHRSSQLTAGEPERQHEQ